MNSDYLTLELLDLTQNGLNFGRAHRSVNYRKGLPLLMTNTNDHSKDKGYTTRQDEAEYGENSVEYISSTELLEHIKAAIATGTGTTYKMIAHPNGVFAGHNVYTRQDIGIDGLSLGKHTNGKQRGIWKPLPMTITATMLFQKAIASVEPSPDWSETSLKKFYKLKASFDYLEDKATEVHKISRSSVRLANDIRYELALSGNPGHNTHKVCPQVSWFSPAIQELDPLDLLPLLPTPEAKTFMAVLGRVLCGASGEQPLETGAKYEHGFRSMAILIGKEGGLGKSQLMNSVKRVLNCLGYSTAVLPTKGRFGWATPILADLATNDDLTSKTQKSLLTHENIKTITTGGSVRTEEKGVANIELNARCAMISSSNYFNKLDYLDMDGGEISRANLLYTYNGVELDKRWTDRYACGARPVNLMPHLEEKYGVSQDHLICYLMARSAELFLSTIGLAVSGTHLERVGKETTSDFIQANREGYTYDSDLTSVPDMVKVIANAMAGYVAGLNDNKAERAMKQIEEGKTLFTPHMLAECIKYTITADPWSLEYKTFGLHMVSRSVISHLEHAVSHEIVECQNLPMEVFFQRIMCHLKDHDGIGFPSKMGSYTYLLHNHTRQIRSLVQDIKDSGVIDNIRTERDNIKFNTYINTVAARFDV